MDFSRALMEERGYGEYRYLTPGDRLPPLFLAYLADPSDSGKMHSDISLRWKRGGRRAVRWWVQGHWEAVKYGPSGTADRGEGQGAKPRGTDWGESQSTITGQSARVAHLGWL